MCKPTICDKVKKDQFNEDGSPKKCGKVTWWGCGNHKNILENVKVNGYKGIKEICDCDPKDENGYPPIGPKPTDD